MGYQYLFQYKDLEEGSLKRITSLNESRLTLDELFLQSFINYVERTSGSISHEGSGYYPRKISELRGESAILFAQMEYEIVSGQENLLKSLGFGRSKKS